MDKPILKVLLINDSWSDSEAICNLLSSAKTVDFSIKSIEGFEQGREWLDSFRCDIVLVDFGHQNGDVIDGIRQLCAAVPDIPIVVLSDLHNERLAIDTVRAGADDFLIKGELNSDFTERALRDAVKRKRACNKLAEKREALGHSDSKLKEQTRILESILHSITDGVVVADREGKFILFNPAAEKLMGLGAADIEPGNWSEHYSLCLSDGFTPFPPDKLPLVRAMRGETLVDEEVFVQRIEEVLSVNGSPLRDEDGALNGGVVVFRDITEKKLADREIHRLNAELEQRVIERTDELASTNAELEAFCYSVSHDLRRPLRHIDGFSLTLLEEYEDRLDPQGVEYLRKVRAGAQRMGELIDAMLQLSRTNRGEFQRQHFDLSLAARSIMSELHKKNLIARWNFALLMESWSKAIRFCYV